MQILDVYMEWYFYRFSLFPTEILRGKTNIQTIG